LISLLEGGGLQHITKLVMSGNPTPLGENSPSDSLPLEFGRLPSESLTSSPALVKQKQCRGACELKIKRSARESESAQSKTNLATGWVDQQTNKKFLQRRRSDQSNEQRAKQLIGSHTGERKEATSLQITFKKIFLSSIETN